MNKSELVKDMKSATGSGFITRIELARYMGFSCPKGVDKYLQPLQRVDDKRYFIGDVADAILMHGGYRNA